MKTAIPGPRSREILERKERVIADPLSVYIPVVVSEGRGSTLTDVDGNTFLDFTGGVGCLNVGHSHPRVVAAAQEQIARFSHTDFTIVPYEVYVRLAERLLERVPFTGPGKAAFFNAGTEAVENAVKFARAYTKRPAVIAFEGAFHGRTLLSVTMTSKVQPVQGGAGAVRARGVSGALPAGVPRAFGRRGARGARARLHDARRRRPRRRNRRRAGAGRGRVPACAARVHARPACGLRPAGDRPRRRRGADGLRTHGALLRHGAFRRRARSDHGREVDRRGAAALGRPRQGGDHGRPRGRTRSAARTSATPSRRRRRWPSST